MDRTRALSCYANLGYAKMCLKDAWPSISSSARFRHDFLCTTLRTRPAGMNTSSRPSYPQEGIMGNSTWNSPIYQTNFTLSPPLLPKTKAAACEQLHIAIEVWILITSCISIIAFIDYFTVFICIVLIRHPFCYFLSPAVRFFWPWASSPYWRTSWSSRLSWRTKTCTLPCTSLSAGECLIKTSHTGGQQHEGASWTCWLLQFFPKCGSFFF